MRKLIIITLLLLNITPCLWAQRKQMSQARSYIKSGKDFDKAETLMADLLKDSTNRDNPKIYLILFQSLQKQYELGNNKLYIKQQYDTASLYNITMRMFSTLEQLDSVDAKPDGKGRMKLKYRERHAKILNDYRPNLFFGGTYYVRKADFAKAYTFFDTYIDCANRPMFAPYNYSSADRRLPSAAYWATWCGHRLGNSSMVLKHSTLAQKDSTRLLSIYRYMADAYLQEKDSSDYLAVLKKGFTRKPTYPYFFPKLIDFYTGRNELDSALAIADRALAVDKHNELFLFAKSAVLLGLGRDDECLTVSDTLISVNDTIPEVYYNAGSACLNKAFKMESDPGSRKDKKAIVDVYRKALPYVEKYRVLAPGKKDRWAPALYRIYLNLNMGKQFEEIDKLLKE